MKSVSNSGLWKISGVLEKAFVGKVKMRLANQCCTNEWAGKRKARWCQYCFLPRIKQVFQQSFISEMLNFQLWVLLLSDHNKYSPNRKFKRYALCELNCTLEFQFLIPRCYLILLKVPGALKLDFTGSWDSPFILELSEILQQCKIPLKSGRYANVEANFVNFKAHSVVEDILVRLDIAERNENTTWTF